MKLPSFSDLLKQSWPLYKKNFATLLGLGLIVMFVSFGLGFLGGFSSRAAQQADAATGGIQNLFKLIGWIVNVIVSIGFIDIYLKIVRNQPFGIKDLYAKTSKFFPFLFGQILTGLVVFLGFLLLVIPGIMWAIKYSYTPYLIVDRNMGPIEAMKASAQLTKGHKGTLFLYGLGFFCVNLLGILALFLGLIITIPLTWIANVLIYISLSSNLQASSTK